jgi:hypothetical protein
MNKNETKKDAYPEYNDKVKPDLLKSKPEVEGLFDYGNIKPEHKEVAKELADFLEKNSNIPSTILSNLIREKFSIIELPKKKISDSKWYEYTKDGPDLGPTLQGWVKTDKIMIPYVNLGASLEDLDKTIDHIISKYKKESEK